MTAAAVPVTPERQEIERSLAACVHCGFCLPACPTYLATADEADSPRGRIVLMRALAHGTASPAEDDVAAHLDACLGCRGCEPVCPSGVAYGAGLEAARVILADARGMPIAAHLTLAVFRRRWLWRPLLALARLLRATGLPRRLAGSGRLGFLFGMLASSRRTGERADGRTGAWAHGRMGAQAHEPGGRAAERPSGRATALLFRGCVMEGLFSHVHAATVRALEAAGYQVEEVRGQGCCGALHAHAGDAEGARALARGNVAAFARRRGLVVVNSAGCGAMLREYAHHLPDDPAAAAVADRVRDVSELLAGAHPAARTPDDTLAAYDAPCHLQHAQRVHAEPLAMLAAVPGLDVVVPATSSQCCGSAGIYSLLEPAMSRAVLEAKLDALAALEPRPSVILTGNPGCIMQIGAGLLARGDATPVRHPVELTP